MSQYRIGFGQGTSGVLSPLNKKDSYPGYFRTLSENSEGDNDSGGKEPPKPPSKPTPPKDDTPPPKPTPKPDQDDGGEDDKPEREEEKNCEAQQESLDQAELNMEAKQSDLDSNYLQLEQLRQQLTEVQAKIQQAKKERIKETGKRAVKDGAKGIAIGSRSGLLGAGILGLTGAIGGASRGYLTDEYSDRLLTGESLDQLKALELEIVTSIKDQEVAIKKLYIPALQKAQNDVRIAIDALQRCKG